MADDKANDDYEALKAQEQANLQESEDARMKRLQQAAAEAPQPSVSTTPTATTTTTALGMNIASEVAAAVASSGGKAGLANQMLAQTQYADRLLGADMNENDVYVFSQRPGEKLGSMRVERDSYDEVYTDHTVMASRKEKDPEIVLHLCWMLEYHRTTIKLNPADKLDLSFENFRVLAPTKPEELIFTCKSKKIPPGSSCNDLGLQEGSTIYAHLPKSRLRAAKPAVGSVAVNLKEQAINPTCKVIIDRGENDEFHLDLGWKEPLQIMYDQFFFKLGLENEVEKQKQYSFEYMNNPAGPTDTPEKLKATGTMIIYATCTADVGVGEEDDDLEQFGQDDDGAERLDDAREEETIDLIFQYKATKLQKTYTIGDDVSLGELMEAFGQFVESKFPLEGETYEWTSNRFKADEFFDDQSAICQGFKHRDVIYLWNRTPKVKFVVNYFENKDTNKQLTAQLKGSPLAQFKDLIQVLHKKSESHKEEDLVFLRDSCNGEVLGHESSPLEVGMKGGERYTIFALQSSEVEQRAAAATATSSAGEVKRAPKDKRSQAAAPANTEARVTRSKKKARQSAAAAAAAEPAAATAPTSQSASGNSSGWLSTRSRSKQTPTQSAKAEVKPKPAKAIKKEKPSGANAKSSAASGRTVDSRPTRIKHLLDAPSRRKLSGIRLGMMNAQNMSTPYTRSEEFANSEDANNQEMIAAEKDLPYVIHFAATATEVRPNSNGNDREEDLILDKPELLCWVASEHMGEKLKEWLSDPENYNLRCVVTGQAYEDGLSSHTKPSIKKRKTKAEEIEEENEYQRLKALRKKRKLAAQEKKKQKTENKKKKAPKKKNLYQYLESGSEDDSHPGQAGRL